MLCHDIGLFLNSLYLSSIMPMMCVALFLSLRIKLICKSYYLNTHARLQDYFFLRNCFPASQSFLEDKATFIRHSAADYVRDITRQICRARATINMARATQWAFLAVPSTFLLNSIPVYTFAFPSHNLDGIFPWQHSMSRLWTCCQGSPVPCP